MAFDDKTRASPAGSLREWRTTALLIALSAIPIGAGAMRLGELGAGAQLTPDNARFFAAPLPIVLHIVGASLYCVLGALQLAPALRRRRPGFHRALGWLLIPCGLAAASAGLWMDVSYQRPEPASPLLSVMRWLFGSAMLLSLLLGVRAIVQRDFARHGVWMLRAYAIGLGAGTQSLLIVPWVVLFGLPPPLAEALLMGAGWLINLAVAERAMRGKTRALSSSAKVARSHVSLA